jgi:hypothetical protein
MGGRWRRRRVYALVEGDRGPHVLLALGAHALLHCLLRGGGCRQTRDPSGWEGVHPCQLAERELKLSQNTR